MKITEERLRANGWERDTDFTLCPGYKKPINQVMRLVVLFSEYQPTFPAVSLLIKHGYLKALPNIRTLEQLSTLFALLGDNPPIDPLDKQARVREAVQAVRVEAMQK